ncbi:hypothetical protein [Promicromonospora sp. NPDC023805]|uniref:hypothetical protein n=1 Tax=Promicromonospora sp. NPDC023805 TaxID=3154696 RepID=UPI0033C9C89E
MNPTIPTTRYGKVRCQICKEFYDIDEGHVCPLGGAAAPTLPVDVVDVAAVPDEDRPHPVGLTWVAPLEARPIVLGPSADHPELRPALALDAHRFWSHARHGLAVGRAEIDLEEAAVWYAIAPNMRTAPERLAYLVETAAVRTAAIDAYVNAEHAA